MTMEVVPSTDSTEEANEAPDPERDDLITCLTNNENICFKSQQRWEPDLSQAEKFKIASDIFRDNKLTFLIKFGKYLNREQLSYFQKWADMTSPDGEEISLILTDLLRNCTSESATVIKNRRYGAMRKMIQEDSYFSEIEMMKRNPLLYDQLVGRYLTKEEVKERNRYEMGENASFVKILMEGIERDDAELQRKKQEEDEDGQAEDEEEEDEDSSDEEDETPAPSYSRWGEFETDKVHRPKQKASTGPITAHERLLLKQEFVTTMYQNFLDGKDEDFNYSNVDADSSLDNVLEEIDNDEEEKYFESEEPMDVGAADCSSEDELDMFMNSLKQHPGVTELSRNLKKL